MKGAQTLVLRDHLETVISAGMNAKIAAAAKTYPQETFPSIVGLYLDEEDYDKVVKTPCVVIFSQGAVPLASMSGGVTYGVQNDICAFGRPSADDGIPVLLRQLDLYVGCLTDLLMTDHHYEAGYWDCVRVLEPVDPQNLADDRFGTLGRIRGYRFEFQTLVDYA